MQALNDDDRALTPVEPRLSLTPAPDASNLSGTIATSDEIAKIKDRMEKMSSKV